MTFTEFISSACSFIEGAIQKLWSIFKVIVKRVWKLLSAFMHAIGDFILEFLSDIRRGLKRIFVVRTHKTELKETIKKAERAGKTKVVPTSEQELFGNSDVKKTNYDYTFVITDNDFNPIKVETASAEELDKKIEEKFNDEVSEIKI